MDVENKFIECLSTTHGAKIVEFFEKNGIVNPRNLCGDAVDVPKENPQKTEMLKRVEELKSNITKMQKQVDEIQAEAEKI